MALPPHSVLQIVTGARIALSEKSVKNQFKSQNRLLTISIEIVNIDF